MTLRVVADANIVDLDVYFGDAAQVTRVDARQLTASDLGACDLLLVRSVTPVHEKLLSDTPVRAVASATSGIDHVDIEYLASRGIFFCHAPGSNADAVVDYVFSAIAACDNHLEKLLNGGSVGIVGCGQVGGRLLQRLNTLGVTCRVYDPLLTLHDDLPLCELEEVLACDVVCLHTPLTRQGEFPTFHHIGAAQLERLSAGQLLINAGRGPTVDNSALYQRLRGSESPNVVLDVWETEPEVELSLLELVRLGSAHIAGYSHTGKRRATQMMRSQLQQALSDLPVLPMQEAASSSPRVINPQACGSVADLLRQAIFQVYDVRKDDALLRQGDLSGSGAGSTFDALRKHYEERFEFADYRVADDASISNEERLALLAVGFHS